MKRMLSLVLVLVLILTLVMPSFAAEVVSVETADLVSYGIIEGDGTGFNEAGELTRAATAKILAFFYGEDGIAYNYALDFGFTDMENNAWYLPWVNYAGMKGYMIGGGFGTDFRPNAVISAQEVNQLMIRVLGYSNAAVAWNNVNAKASQLGVAVTAADPMSVTRGEAFKAIRRVLDATPVNGTMTLGSSLNLPNYIAPYVALEVDSVMTNNLAEINVKFNKALDPAKVVVGNFKVDGVDAASVVLSADKMNVVVTPATIATANPASYTLLVKQAVGLVLDYTENLSPFDVTIPSITDIVVTGPVTFDILFSEPVQNTGTVMVNNGAYGSTAAAPVGNKVTVTLGTALPDGNYSIKVSGYTDFANFAMLTVTETLAYAADISVASVTLGNITQNSVEVIFNKQIATILNTNHFYHTFSGWNPDSVVTTDNLTYTLTFTSYPIPAGNFNLSVLATDGTTKVTDVWGIDLGSNVTLIGSVTADTTAPTAVLKQVVSEQIVQVEYSEAVMGATTAANYVAKKPNGSVIPGVTVTLSSGNIYNVDLGAKQMGGAYTLEISNVKDMALSPNTMANTVLGFMVTDITPPAVTAVSWVNTPAAMDEFIYVTFDEAIATSGANSGLDKNNYLVNGSIVPTSAVAFGSENKKVKLAVADTTTVTSVTWGQIADIAGNKIASLSTTTGSGFPVPALTLEGAITAGNITSMTTKSLNTVEIVIDKVIPVVNTSAFTVVEGAGGVDIAAPAMVSFSNDGINTTVLLTLTSTTAMINSADKPAQINFIASGLISDVGTTNALFSIAAGGIIDGIAPSYSSVEQVDADTFTITFNEPLNTTVGMFPLMATDLLVKKASGTQLIAGIDYTITALGAVVTVDLTLPLIADETLTVASISAPLYIKDLGNNNKINAFTVKNVVMDLTPVAATVTAMNATTNDADSLVITFSEALYVSGIAAVSGPITGFTASGSTVISSAVYNLAAKTVTFVLATAANTDTLVAGATLTDAFGNGIAATNDVATYASVGTVWTLN